MNSVSNGLGKMSLRARRRMIAAAAYGLLAAGIVFGAAASPVPSRGPATAASRPAATAGAKAAAQAQYVKARDLFDAGKYAEAQTENERALALDPANSDAALMKRVLENKLSGTGATAATSSAGVSGKVTPLTATQISLIKIYEMSSGENIRGKIDRAVLEDFWNEVYIKDPLFGGDTSKQSHDAYLNASNFAKQVYVFKQANQQKYLEKVTVTTDPQIMLAYKTGVHTYMMANCATSECHGGDKAGTFHLLTPTGTGVTPEVFYTNFYVMSMYANKDGKMLDRDAPEKSLFLQYSLPWTTATFKHPKTDIKKIPNTQDARFRSMYEWVRALVAPRPNYGITYEVSGMKEAAASKEVPATTKEAPAPR